MTTFAKAVEAADQILKGEAAPFTSRELEDAMMKYAEDQRRADETGAQAFVRLIDERNDAVEKLHAAAELRRVAEQHGHVLRKHEQRPQVVEMVDRASALVDRYVEINKRADESAEQAHARLARDDEQYGEFYEHLSACRRLL